jgi:hypothetical protein
MLLVPILSLMQAAHNFPPHLPKIYANIISYLRVSLPQYLPLSFADKYFYALLVSSTRAKCLSHLFIGLIILMIFGDAYKL